LEYLFNFFALVWLLDFLFILMHIIQSKYYLFICFLWKNFSSFKCSKQIPVEFLLNLLWRINWVISSIYWNLFIKTIDIWSKISHVFHCLWSTINQNKIYYNNNAYLSLFPLSFLSERINLILGLPIKAWFV
jgi:hypothetical protein